MKAFSAFLLLVFLAPFAIATEQCTGYSACGACTEDADCKWCPSNSQCFPLGTGHSLCPGGEWAFVPSECAGAGDVPLLPCSEYSACEACADSDHCRWCLSRGGCYPLDSGTCPDDDWALIPWNCPTPEPTQTMTPEPTPAPTYAPDAQESGGLPCLPALLLPAGCLLLLASRKRI